MSPMDIKLLLAPDFLPRTKFSLPPMGIASLTASLRLEGHSVEQDDLDIRNRQKDLTIFERQDRVEAWLEGRKPFPEMEEFLPEITALPRQSAVGLSVAEPSHLTSALCLAKWINEQSKATTVIGGRISINQYLMKHKFLDYAIMGDAEESFVKLAAHLDGKQDIEGVPGLIYRDKSVRQNPLSLPELQDVPAPDFDGLPMELYEHGAFDTVDPYYETYGKTFPISSEDKVLMLPYLLTKGCSFSCSFCGVSASKNQSVLYKSAEKIAEDTARLSKRHRTPYFFFMDSTVNCDDSWLESVSDHMAGQDLLWSDSATPKKFTTGLLAKMRKAGCVRLTWGVESLSNPVLKRMRKPFNAETALKTLKEADRSGIWNYTNWIAGFPHEAESHLKETLQGIRSANVDDYTVTGFILQDSDIRNQPEQYGIRPGDRSAYSQSAHDRMETGSYEEIDGLGWKDKQRQIESYRVRMNKALSEQVPFPLPMHTVFYLYNKFNHKEEIHGWLKSLT
jgi:hypothetical protein